MSFVYHNVRKLLNEAFPAAFPARGQPCLPLKLGIRDDIVEVLPEVSEVIGSFLAIWCSRPEYHKAVLNHDIRIGLNGEVAGMVTETETNYHKYCLNVMNQRKRLGLRRTDRPQFVMLKSNPGAGPLMFVNFCRSVKEAIVQDQEGNKMKLKTSTLKAYTAG